MHLKNHRRIFYFLLLLFLVNSGCGEKEKKNVRGEYIYRNQDEYFFIPSAPLPHRREEYPWESKHIAGLPRITKEHFRCKGNPLNPVVVQKKEGKETQYYRDCQGAHGLPLREGKEFVYECLLDLLNYIQEKTEKKVIVTTGHRCPQHNTYNDASPTNWGSKHMLGAEVDFYVEGLEKNPQTIIDLVQQYYREKFPTESSYNSFIRYEKKETNVSIPPWYNKEVFVKLYLTHEGRDFDNQHPFPYIGIQVRYDREQEAKVIYDQKQAQNYLRR